MLGAVFVRRASNDEAIYGSHDPTGSLFFRILLPTLLCSDKTYRLHGTFAAVAGSKASDIKSADQSDFNYTIEILGKRAGVRCRACIFCEALRGQIQVMLLDITPRGQALDPSCR